MWNGLVSVAKETYTASLGEGVVPRPVMMPLVRGELVGLIWMRPLKVGQDALAGIAELANVAAAAGADEVVLAWETHDVATACELPIVGPAPCLNMLLATQGGHVLHQFPYSEQLLSRSPEGWASVAPDWRGPRTAARRRTRAADPGRGELLLHSHRSGPPRPVRRSVVHAEVRLGDSVVMIAGADTDYDGPGLNGASVGSGVYLCFPEPEAVDDWYAAAVAAGAQPVLPPEETAWGSRRARVLDTEGHEWSAGNYQPGKLGELRT